ncbi:MAG: hypothetical protein PV362_06965 [Providencia heimbachae]|nr:hypothetical protein [Providencia heimbachae]
MTTLTKALMAVCVILIVWLGWVIRDYFNLKEDYGQLQKDNTQQTQIIATQSLEFNRFNQISNTAYRYGIQAEAKSQEKVIEYRTILKRENVCDMAIPDDISDGVLSYAEKLRSGAMHTDTIKLN